MKKSFSMPRIDSKFLIISFSVALLLVFVVLPMINLIQSSFILDGELHLGSYREVYSKDVNWRALTNTIQLSFVVMFLSIVITLPLAWLVGRTDLPCKGIFRTTLVASYMIPPYVGAIAWVQLLNPSVGYLNSILKWVFSPLLLS